MRQPVNIGPIIQPVPVQTAGIQEGHTFTIIPWVGLKNTKKAVWLGTTDKMTAVGVEALTNFAVDVLRIV